MNKENKIVPFLKANMSFIKQPQRKVLSHRTNMPSAFCKRETKEVNLHIYILFKYMTLNIIFQYGHLIRIRGAPAIFNGKDVYIF